MPSSLVSIIVPTYNRARLLDECLRNARSAPAGCEILVVDNASTDKTPAVVARHAAEDSRIRSLRNERNIGMVPNFNLALREAKGDYLCLVCDDDLILPGHIEEKAALLDAYPEIGFVYCPWVLIDGDGRSQAVPLGSGMLTYGYVGGRDEFGDLLQNNHIMMNAVLLRKSLLEQYGYMTEDPRFAPANDWELWLRLTRYTETAYLPEPRVCVRFHEASETAKTGNNHTRSAAARLNLWRKYLLEDPTPVVLNEHVWERMRALFVQDLNYWFGGDQTLVLPYVNEFDQIRAENRARASSRLRPTTLETAGTPIHWHANLFDFSGYARLGRDAILALDRAGERQSVEAVGGSPKFLAQMNADPEAAAFWRGLQQTRRADGAFVCFGVPALWNGGDWFGHHRAANPGHSRYAGICMFETDRLPSGWAAACNGMDEVWVPSEFNRETFTRAGVAPDKLHVIPFGIDASAYDPETVQPLDIPDRRGFTFLSVFQWSERKGWDVLLKAYLRAFSAQDDVCLVLRTYPDREDATPIRNRVDRFVRECGYDPKESPTIVILDEFIAEDAMPSLYRAADAFVLPTRGEGWGIPYMEAMASGLPVIATRWSAHLDFMNDKNSYLIDVDGLAPLNPAIARENPFYTPDQRWAEPSVSHTARLMRQVFERRDEARTKGARARRDILENWPMERTARWIAERVASPTPNRAVVSTERLHATRTESGLSISWQAPLFDPSGYAEEARHFLLALDEASHTVAAEPIRWSDRVAVLPAADERRLLAMTARAPKPGGIHVSHIFPPSFTRRPNARINAGRTMFETDRLPDGWADACNQMDQIWVPSEFNRETFARAGVREEKLRIVPGVIDMRVYPDDLAPLDIPDSRGFNFLSVFDWSLRKGWDLLLRAYVEEFSGEEDVALIIKTHSSLGYTVAQIGEQIVGYIGSTLGRDMSRTPDIILQDMNLPAHRMPNLYRAADCFVLPTRGEGWGRPYMEAMASGLPVIGTNWSGNTAFMNRGNSYLLDSEVVDVPEPAWREAPTFRGHRWAEPNVDQLRAHMRRVFTNREESRAIGRAARAHIAAHFSYERVAAIIEETVQEPVPLSSAA